MEENMLKGAYINENVLNVQVCNIAEFEELIETAKKQAQELQKTIDRLEYFNLKFKFEENRD